MHRKNKLKHNPLLIYINLFRKDISKFLNLSVIPTQSINSSVPNAHFQFQLSQEFEQ